MKNDDILFIVNSYYALKSKGKDTVALPASVAWKRRLNLKELIKASEIINEALKEISERYDDEVHAETKITKDVDGNDRELRVVKPEYVKEFTAAQQEVLIQDTDVTIRKIKIGELGDIPISEEQLDTIEFMIDTED